MIVLERLYKKPDYTIGKLYVDGKYFCDTIEDHDRGLTDKMPLREIIDSKVEGETAIPTGTYRIVTNIKSPRYSQVEWYRKNMSGGFVPRLLGVKGFSGILIHAGNYASHTDGCILVGKNKVRGGLINSRDTLLRLYKEVLKGRNDINITIQ